MSMRISILLRAVLLSAMVAASSPAFCAVVTWDAGGGNGNWSTPTNWSTNVLPTSSDDVVIDNTTSFDTVLLDQNATVQSISVGNGVNFHVQATRVLTVDGPSVSNVALGGDLRLDGASPTGGSFLGNGALTVDGVFGVHGNCTLGGSGAVTISNTGGLEVGTTNPTAVMSISRNITNSTGGTITFLSTSVGDASVNATITNAGLIDIQNDEDLNGTATINNNSGGVLRKTIATGTSVINFTVNNAAGATIETQTGLIQLNGGGTASGNYSIVFPNFLRLGGGTFTMSGTPTVTGGGLLSIFGATLDAGAGVDVTCPNVELRPGGTITGPGTVRVSGTFTWRGGTIAGSGPRVLNSTSTPTFPCNQGPCQLDGAALQLQASTTFSASSNALVFSNGAILTIDTSKAFAITNDGNLTNGGGAASSIIDNGKIWKRITSGTSTIGVPVTLSGTSTVEIDDGTLQFGGGASVSGSGATFEIDPGMTLEVTGGVFDFNSGSVFFPFNGDFKVSSGFLRVSGFTLTIPNLTLQGGILDGAGDLHVSGNFNWLGGTILGLGARVLDSTSTPVITCTSVTHCNIDGATLQMNASGTFNATTNSLVFFNGANFIIASGKTLDFTTDGTIVGLGGTITNNGTITKSGGAGIRSIGTPLNNNGSVTVTSGGLSLLANGTHGGSFTVTAPGSMLFDGGTHTIAGGITGNGILAINGATVTLNATGNAGNLVMSGGTLGGSGTLTLANGGTWSGGTMSGSGTTAVAAGQTLTVSGFPTLNGRALDLNSGAMLDITSQRLEVASAATVTGSGTVRVNGGTLRVLTGVTQTIPNLTLAAGVADGAGALHVSGNFTWSGGTIAGSGSRLLTSTSTPGITCSASCTLDGAALQLQASSTFSASTNALVFSNGASLTIDPGKTLNVTNAGDFSSGAGGGSIVNDGTIRKLTTAGTSTIGVPVTLSGTSTVDIDSGTLQFGSGATVASGATLDIATFSPLEVTGGVFLFNSGSVSKLGSGAFMVSSTGTLRVPTGITITISNVALMAGGVIDGGGTLILSSTNSWGGGTMGSATAPGGITEIDSGATLNVLGGTLTQNRIVRNNGTLNLPSSGGISGSSSTTIENNGTMARNTGSGTIFVGPRVENNNGATVSAAVGTLAFVGGGIAAGAYAISSGATLSLAFGTFTVATTATVTGPGTLSAATGGTLDAGAGVDLTIPNLTLALGGEIDGPGIVRVSGNFTWSAGTITGSGARVLNSASVPAISCSSGNCLLDGATLQFQEHGTYSASANALVLSNGASLVLDPGKILFVTNDGDFVNGGGAASSIVIGGFGSPGLNGCIQKITTAGTSIIGIPVTMLGSFFVDTGTMQVAADVTAVAGAIVHYSVGATLELTGGLFLLNSSAISFPANGDFEVSGGTLRVPTGVTVTARNVTLQGSGVIDGGGTLNLSGTSTWSAGTMSGSGTTVIPATMSLGISAPVTLSRTLQNDGTLTVSGDITGSGTIDNQGTLNAVGNITIGVAVNNSGQIATSNALSLAGGGTHTGSFGVTSPGNLSFPSGTHSFSGGGSIAGTGTLSFNGATATIGVPVNVGALSVSAGTATLDANGSADAFTMTGGTLGGSGTLTLNNGGTWSGGTMSGSGTTINPATKTLTISAPVTLDSRTLLNLDTLTVSGDISGSGTIDNAGTLDSVADLTIGAVLNNSGLVTTSNALSLAGGGSHTGLFGVTSPGILSFPAGTHSFSGGGSITGTGTLSFNGATATAGVPVNVGALNVSAGTATLNDNGSADAFTMTGGTLGGSGMLTLNNGGTWSGGTMSGSGTTVNPATKSFGISAPVTLSSRTLQNDGTLTVSANVSGSGTIANNGTLSPVGNIAIGAALNNSGQIATSALLSLGGNGAHSGTFTVTAPGVINFSGGTQTISGTLAGTGTLRFSGAAATISGTWTGMPVEVTSGSAAFNTNGTIPALTLSGGTLTGSGDVIVSGPSTWSGGTIAGSGDFKFDTGATVTMPGTNLATLARGLLNEGTIHFTAASNGMLIDGARLRNYGTFDIQSSQTIAATAGTPSFVNGGTLKKSSGEGVMQFGAPLSNSGLVRIESGTMQFGGAYAQSAGRTTVLSSAKLQAATISLNGGSLTGNGTVAGTVANHATISPGTSPGTLTVNGDFVQSSGGTLEIQLGGTAPGTQYDRLLVSGSVTLAGTLDVTTTNSFTPTTGNAFQILTFGSRTGNSTFDVMNGLNGLVPVFSANELQLVSQVVVPVAADAGIAVTGPGSTIAGSKVIYTVTVSNIGPDTATNIAVTAIGSAGLTFSANSGACMGSFPCNIATLGPGQSATIHSAWDIAPSATGSVQLTVNSASAADPDASNNSDTAVTNLGTCPAITIVAPSEMTTGLTAEATATGFDGAEYHWSIVNGTISRGDGTAGIEFIAGGTGTTTLTVNVTGDGCSLSAAWDVTVKPRCIGTAMPTTPADAVTADAVVDFAWSVVDDASGYRLWLQQGGAPAQNLGTSLGTSRTKIIPPGTYQWYVETLFDGCASHESERRTLTILPAQDCASREKPQLTAPANETPATSAAVAFSWNAVPQALEYELWLALAGGVPTLIRSTSDTSYTAVVPPGRLEWYVRAIFAGCAATESAHRAFTYTPPPECTNERPLRIAPLEGERLTSPVSFEWTGVSGATSYELYVDGELAATTTSPHASDVALPRAERRWRVRALLGGNCGAVDSAESRLVVIAPSPSCAPLAAPALSAPAQISSGTAGRIQWSFVPGATAYEIEISGDPQFPRGASSTSTVTARQMPITFTNLGGAPVERYVRVHAVDTNCVQPGRGAFSPVAAVSVLPPAGSATGNEGVALLTDPTDVHYTLSIGAELAGQSFTATPTVPWLSVTPSGGIVPPGGQTLLAVAHTAGLPAGTSIADVEITTTAPAGALTALATTPPVKLTISINNIPGFTTTPKSTPPPDALVFPAVASVRNFVVRYDSDIHVTNTSAKEMSYEINFVPTGPAGMKEGKKTNIDLKPGATLPVRDIVKTWFGGRNSMTGTMEVRPLTETDTSTSSAPVGGLSDRITFASSRTFSTTAGGGTYGQYIPAVPYANFIDQGRTLSLQHVAQSDDKYRTNLGLVEGSGDEVVLEVRVFDAAGAERASFPVGLAGGERKQLDSVLSEHGVQLDDGRIEVEVISGAGKVTAYASVLDKVTNDPQFVPPVTLGNAGHSKWVVPGVADLVSDSGNWQTDLRIFNAGTEPADLTLAFYSMNGGPPTTGTIQLAAGKVSQLDRILFTFFGIARDAGALHISSAAPAQIVATARTYKQTPGGDYGQFIAALTPDDAVAAGTRPLQILQMEESRDFKSNIGFAEVSGKPVTLEVTVFTPNSTGRSVRLKLEPNQFQQLNLNSLFASFDLGALYNARISVSAVAGEGEGRALAYGSLLDLLTGDPTYIPGQ